MRRSCTIVALALASIARPLAAEDVPVPPWLEKGDPVADGTVDLAITSQPDPEQLESSLRKILARPDLKQETSDRAHRLLTVVRLVRRVRAGDGERPVEKWLALDDLARTPPASRAVLLPLAIADERERKASIERLEKAREVATRFCLDWNEISTGDEQVKTHAALQAELEKSGFAAAPLLLDVLSVPPYDAFVVMDPAHGVTGRQQVRALYGLGFLGLRETAPYLVFHTRGPSLTGTSVAAGTLQRLTGADLKAGNLADPDRVRIDAWWREHRDPSSFLLDHFARHVLGYLAAGLRAPSEFPFKIEGFQAQNAKLLVQNLSLVLGDEFAYDDTASEDARRLQLAAIERRWWKLRGD